MTLYRRLERLPTAIQWLLWLALVLPLCVAFAVRKP